MAEDSGLDFNSIIMNYLKEQMRSNPQFLTDISNNLKVDQAVGQTPLSTMVNRGKQQKALMDQTSSMLTNPADVTAMMQDPRKLPQMLQQQQEYKGNMDAAIDQWMKRQGGIEGVKQYAAAHGPSHGSLPEEPGEQHQHGDKEYASYLKNNEFLPAYLRGGTTGLPTYMQQRELDWHIKNPQFDSGTYQAQGPGAISDQELKDYKKYMQP